MVATAPPNFLSAPAQPRTCYKGSFTFLLLYVICIGRKVLTSTKMFCIYSLELNIPLLIISILSPWIIVIRSGWSAEI